jgi:hypothetical protein
MSNTCICTIASKNYLPHARVLMKSFLRFHPVVKTFVLLADKVDGYFDPADEPFEVLEADSLGIKDFDSFSFKYNIVEFNTAVKPFFLDHLFSQRGFTKILYFDPDIVVFNELTRIFDLLDNYSIVLTPHITQPLPDDGRVPRDIDILKVGCFNLGFIGLAKSKNSGRLLSWWKERLYDTCLQGPVSGYAVDQVWISLVPCLFDDYYILRDPGYNIAYWNLHERTITKEQDEFLINRTPLYFFHFSGINIANLERISKYQNRFTLTHFPVLKELLEMYKNSLMQNGFNDAAKWPYKYGFSSTGKQISDVTRGIFWGLGVDSEEFGNPFENFYRKFLHVQNVRRLCTDRFLRAMLDKLAMKAWNFMLKRKK